MPIVGGLDIHRKQITFDYLDTGTGQVCRGQIAPADREHVRAWLARFAGLVSMLGFAQTLSSGDGLWVLSGLGTAIFFLYAAWRRHLIAIAASVLLLAVVALGGLLAHFRAPAQAAGASAPAAGSAPVEPSTGAAASNAPAGTPPVRIVEVTLPRHAAVDLDSGAQPTVVAGQIGATGRFDLYHDAGEVMSDVIRTPDGMYSYPVGSSPDSAYAIRSDYTSPKPLL